MIGTNLESAYSTTVYVALANGAGNATLIRCAAASLPTSAGFAIGCIAEATDTGAFYTNTGTATTASFTLVSASSVTLATALTDSSTTTGTSLSATYSAITSGTGISSINGNTTNFVAGATLFKADLGTAVAGNGLTITGTGAYTGTGLAIITTAAMTTGVGLQLTSTTGLTSGSLLRATTSTAGAVATNGVISIRATGAYTSTSNAGLLDVQASATLAGTIVNVIGNALTTGVALNVTGTGAYTGAGFVTITSAATTGNTVKITANSLTSGTGLLITSSSTDSTARGLISLTNSGSGSTGTALVYGTQVVQSTHFYRILTEATSGVTLWFSDGTTASGNLTGVAGDICFNAGSHKPEYCSVSGTTWVALV